ncbi:MAG: hypothetical protein HY820_36215 [Acidobacteria bacterium]|nr:hypothetical protein [Acidobacteriota bacterium]
MRRRDLLAMPLSLAAAPAPRIRTVDVLPVSYPVTGHFKFFPKPERPTVMVKITLEDGTVGWGQSVPVPTWSYETPESAEDTLRRYLAPRLIGRDPLDIAGAHLEMRKAISPSFSTGMPITKAGIDLALHDIAAKLARQSMNQFWKRKPVDKIDLSWTLNPATMDDLEPLMEEGKRRGYRHYNIKVAPDPKADLDLARRVRKYAPNCFLWADANGGYDTGTALTVAPKLADAGVNVLEQPVASNRLSGFAALRKQKALPILMDEGLVSHVELEEFFKLGLLDGVAFKPARTAGLYDAIKQLQFCEREGLMVLGSGLTDPDVSLAASLAIYGAARLKYPAALNGLQFLTASYLKKPFVLEGGALRVPTGIGLGVEVNEEAIRRARRG